MLCNDPNESSAVYLLTSDDKHSVWGTVFPPNQLLYRKYLALFFFVEETFDHMPVNRYADMGWTLGIQTPPWYSRYNGHEKGRKPWKGTQEHVNEFFTIFQRNSILHRQKKKWYSILYLTGQNRGLSRLKNIWPVIRTGDLLSVILSPEWRNNYYYYYDKTTSSCASWPSYLRHF